MSFPVFSPLLIVLSGPSGVGKDSVIQRMKDRSLPFHFVVTATTRKPRTNEVHGKDYLFLSSAEFSEMIFRNEFLEYSLVYNDYKGVPRQQIKTGLMSGLDVVMRIDVQGVFKIRAIEPNIISIFIAPESDDVLISRLKARDSESNDSLKQRITEARNEMKLQNEFDYCVINRQLALDDTVDQIMAILRKEHSRKPPKLLKLLNGII